MEIGPKHPFEVIKGGKPNSSAKPVESLADLKKERIVDINDIDFYAPQRGETTDPTEVVDFGKLLIFPTHPPKSSA